MSEAVEVWARFALCAGVIGVAGVKLTTYGDAIADKTGMGGTWIGLVLIATVTSLPELASGVAASAIALVPDIAAGDALGSCVYNLAILGLMDWLRRGEPVLSVARPQHVLSAGFGVVLLGVAALGLASGLLPGAEGAAGDPSGLVLAIGWTTPLLLALYAFAIRTLYRYQAREVAELTEAEADRFPELTLRQVAVRYALAAAFVVLAGVWLPFVSADISRVMGWEQSFTGTLFTAMSTSLPELVVTVAALRIGAVDLAVGNLFGSNLFNLLILAVDDIVYLPGSLLASVSPVHVVSTVTAMTMSGVAIVGIFYRPPRRVLGLVGWPSLLLLALFALNSWLVYALGAV